jgi:lysophospholipase L1-like esterase
MTDHARLTDSPTTEGKARRRYLRPLIFLLSIPLFVLAIEIIFAVVSLDTFFANRFFLVNRSLDYPEVFMRDPDIFWRFRPSQEINSRFFEGKSYRINSSGLRGDEIPPRSDKKRLVFLGNSCTFGWGVSEEQTFVKLTERLLNERQAEKIFETINAGIPGFSSFQGRRFYVSDMASLKPEIVFIMFAWNDQWAAGGNIPDNQQKSPPKWIIKSQNLFSRLKIYRLLRKIILSVTEPSLEDKLDRQNPVYRVSLEDFYGNLYALVNFIRSEGSRPILLTSPAPSLTKYYPPGSRSQMHYYHELYNSQTRLVARNSRAELIDIAGIFDDFNDLFDNAPNDPIHFNATGHKVIAEKISEYLSITPWLDKMEPVGGAHIN